MPVTIALVSIALLEFLLLLFTGWKFMATALVWTALVGFLVFLVEVVLMTSGALDFFFGNRPKK